MLGGRRGRVEKKEVCVQDAVGTDGRRRSQEQQRERFSALQQVVHPRKGRQSEEALRVSVRSAVKDTVSVISKADIGADESLGLRLQANRIKDFPIAEIAGPKP